MRVVSMVPSWTETLVEAGADVVGRTRFCIHPKNTVTGIPVVGGTKDINIQKLTQLRADILLLDKEENPRTMSELNFPYFATHIASVQDVASALYQLSELLGNPKLLEFATRWKKVSEIKYDAPNWDALPVIEWIKPRHNVSIKKVYYVIWRDPWMIVSGDTFIGSVLAHLGFGKMVDVAPVKYPVVDWAEINRPENCILFSSEPYPFLKKKNDLPRTLGPAAIVDGESMSWFGLRALKYLEACFQPR